MWDLPGPGLEPVSPELAGGFLTTEPPGKSLEVGFLLLLTPLCPPDPYHFIIGLFFLKREEKLI